MIARADDDDTALANILRPEFAPRTAAVAVTRRPDAVPAARGRVRLARDAGDAIDIRADLSRAGLVVLADRWAKGWSVAVDGRPARAVRVDSVLRGVEVPTGRHDIRWSYAIPGLKAAAAASAVGIAAILAIGAWELLLMRRRR